MNRLVLTSAVCLSLLLGARLSIAQDSPPVIDPKNPPPGFVVPKPAEERDVSMARYARESYLDGEEGIVGLRVVVRPDGSVGDARIVTSSGSMRLDQSAQDLVKGWRYVPATLNGAPVETTVPVQIIWALETLRFELSPAAAAKVPAFYPLQSVVDREQGASTVRFLKEPDGSVAKAFVDRPSGYPRLDGAAIDVIRSLRFSPGSPAWFRMTIEWRVPNRRPRPTDVCGAPAGTSGDRQIRACTEFLASTSRTAYQRAHAYRTRGLAHAAKGDFDQALADYEAGIRVSPGIAEIYVSRAEAYLAKGNRELAFGDFDSAIQVEPLAWDIRTARGDARSDAGQTDLAMADYNEAVRNALTPDQPFAYKARCYFLARIGRAQEALADCDQSLSLRPRFAGALDSRGYAKFRLGQYQAAIQDYDRALQIDSRLEESLYARGVAKLKLGQRGGDADIDAAKKLNPEIERRMSQVGVAP